MNAPPLALLPEIADALAGNRPVVALESTIITHGMPKPQNVETALAVEAEIRAQGAVPATIAVMAGQIHVGLHPIDLEELASAQDVRKLSRADIAHCLSSGATGATTVAATMIAANLAGIKVFATGGIGGVHRGAGQSFDVSADIQELAQTAVTVVSAGPKAILDIPATLEVLETLGVPVFAFGQSALPAFWSRNAGFNAPLRADHPNDIADAHRMRATLGLPGGQLVTNPIPKNAEIPPDVIGPLIAAAQDSADRKGITGKDVTPFLLDEIFRATDGASLTANIELVKNNARLASDIAIELSR